jgi:hypothetical protein
MTLFPAAPLVHKRLAKARPGVVRGEPRVDMRTASHIWDAVATHGPGYQACTCLVVPGQACSTCLSRLDARGCPACVRVPGARGDDRPYRGRRVLEDCSTPLAAPWEPPESATGFMVTEAMPVWCPAGVTSASIRVHRASIRSTPGAAIRGHRTRPTIRLDARPVWAINVGLVKSWKFSAVQG